MAQESNDLKFEIIVENDGTIKRYPLDIKGKTKVALFEAMNILQNTPQSGFTFTSKVYSFGHMITSINGVKNNDSNKTAWMIYLGDKKTNKGVDDLFPKTGDVFSFKFEHYESNSYEEAMLA